MVISITTSKKERKIFIHELIKKNEEIRKLKIEIENNRVEHLQYKNLRKHFQKLVDDVLGVDYYNEAMDIYKSDEFCCRDLRERMKCQPFRKRG